MFYRKSQINKEKLINITNTLATILSSLKYKNKLALIVGGAVRDSIYGRMNNIHVDPKDIDIEVYGMYPDELEQFLKQIYNKLSIQSGLNNGMVDTVGKSFGVIKFTDPTGKEQYDFSIPRTEMKTGVGHKAFEATPDPNITPEKAASRRDFTINAIAYDPLEEQIYDFYGGEKDLKNKILKATSNAFMEDPLRVLRGMQFASRFGLRLDTTTKIDGNMTTSEMCELAGQEYSTLAKERIAEEFMKLSTKGKFPGMGLEFLIDSGWIKYYPALEALFNTQQDPEWHPEGNVGIHTVHVMNAAADIADKNNLSSEDRSVLVLSAMLHDIAKPDTTEEKEKNGRMRITSHGHEKAGGPKSKEFLQSLGIKKSLINKIVPLIENHLAHITAFNGEGHVKGIRHLANNLYPSTIEELIRLIEADHSGRPPLPKELPSQAKLLYDLAKQEELHNQLLGKKDIIPGNIVMKLLKTPGKHIGEIQDYIYNLYLNGKINRQQAEEAFLNYAKNIKLNNENIAVVTSKDLNHILPQNRGKILNDAIKAQYNGELTFENKEDWLINEVEKI